MKLPLLVPEYFEEYRRFETDEELFEALSGNVHLLVDFFCHACDDETWAGKEHVEFISKCLDWFETKSVQNTLAMSHIHEIADTLQYHHDPLKNLISRSITLQLQDKSVNASGLLMIACSDYFHDLIRSNATGGDEIVIQLDVEAFFWVIVQEYLETGLVDELWRETPEQLHVLMGYARKWDLEELAILCEEVLVRYIDRSNVYEQLLQAHLWGWPHLKNACIDFINDMNRGIRFKKGELDQLICRFEDLKVHTLDDYRHVEQAVNILQFSGSLPDDPAFLEVVERTPHLKGLDLSDTIHFVEAYRKLPSTITELYLNRCFWLNSAFLREFARTCPKVSILHLVSSPHLDVSTFAVLSEFKYLKILDIARCKVDADAFSVILAAARGVETLNVNECSDIPSFSFTELARLCPELVYLYASKTECDDGSLAEMAQNSKRLIYLDISRCRNISDKGILTLAHDRSSLRTLIIKGCDVTEKTIQSIKKDRPHLKVFI